MNDKDEEELYKQDAIRLEHRDGTRLLHAGPWPSKAFSVRILTEDAMRALPDGNWKLYYSKVQRLVSSAASNARIKRSATVKAYDYLRHAIRRERNRRATISWEEERRE